MKLYYDNLVAYMPDSVVVDGKPIPDSKLTAARRAMMSLSDFQNSNNIADLYESIRQISIYSEISIPDLLFSLKDIEIDETQNLDSLLDIAAKNLFQTATPNYDPKSFDFRYYTALLMYVAHAALIIKNRMLVEELYKQSENNSAEGESS
jgi:hypothetical protein